MRRLLYRLRLLQRMNWVMTLAVGLLLTIGVLFVYSACYVSDEQPVRGLYERQIVWAMVGFASYAFFAVYDYRKLRKFAWWLYAASLILLVVVLIVGKRIYGARRWLDLGVGVQPSELAKLSLVLVMAGIISRTGDSPRGLRTVALLFTLVGLPVLLILKEPDLGTALVFVPTTFAMMYVGGVSLRLLGGLVLTGVLVGSLVLGALVLPEKLNWSAQAKERVAHLTGLSEYQRDRILIFLGVEKDPLGAGWNKMQSEISVGSGGPWGKGYLKGTQNILGFLPRSVAPTDFIYAVIAEETGFFGSVVVLALFAVVLTCTVMAASLSRDRMGRLLCVGIAAVVFSHVFINIAMTVGLMPITGLPLPLLSYGGSFMVVVMSALGIVQSVYIRSQHGFMV